MFYGGAGHGFHLLSDRGNYAASLVSAFVMNSTAYALTDGTYLAVNFAHGLGHVPAFVRAVLICTINDTNSHIVVGQEVAIESVIAPSISPGPQMVFSTAADVTKIYLSYTGIIGNETLITVLGDGLPVSSYNNFSLKVYWQ